MAQLLTYEYRAGFAFTSVCAATGADQAITAKAHTPTNSVPKRLFIDSSFPTRTQNWIVLSGATEVYTLSQAVPARKPQSTPTGRHNAALIKAARRGTL